MKKLYILAFLVGAFSISSQAQVDVEDDFESYTLGPISPQASHWRSWSGTSADDGLVVASQAQSGSQSLLIPDDETTDNILLFPYGADEGFYTVQFSAYIPTGQSGYFNMQAALTPEGDEWQQALMGGNVYFNCDSSSGGTGGVTGVIDCTAFDQVFTYPESEWFQVKLLYDIDNQVWDMYINGTQAIFAQPFEFGDQEFEVLAGLDFFSASITNEMYVDDVLLYVGILGTDDLAENTFSVYPNPVKDVLNIQSKTSIDNVTVYDVLGKVVLQANPGKISPAINTSSLASGSYLVKITSGDTSKTIKVLK
ncbi:T9SS type A sorting domain-containing protein [Aequorivita marina]|uniref:T9SS type A sorting domain-containing protein n=1 Tax=Aequorivita marina TaxID=3073654 RepID=UPI00287479C4|nr:T9SS type A sorting domain-containing protein [Aequorivita sp. S2608]MDS1299303.1 T9SS type A sorting domain-containing protein [Aequorivita sp. S2608]